MIERINRIIKDKNISASQLANVIGVQRSSISHILSGRNRPSLDFVQKILKAYPDISSNWILMGRGSMYISSIKSDQPKKTKQDNPDLFSDIPSLEITEKVVKDEAAAVYHKEENFKYTEAPKRPKKTEKSSKSELDKNSFPKDRVLKKLILVYSDMSFEELHPAAMNNY